MSPVQRRRLVIVLAILLTAAGCTIRPPNKSELRQVRAGEKSIVLLRFAGTQDGEPFTAVGVESTKKIGYRLGLADVDRQSGFSCPEQIFLSPSRQARRDGWTYLLLEPGTWYLAVQPVIAYTRDDLSDAPGFLLHIPPDSPLVYAGTIHFTGRTHKNFLGTRYLDAYDPAAVTVLNEPALAQAMARTSFTQFAAPRDCVVSPYGPNESAADLAQSTSALRVQVCALGGVLEPDLRKRDIERGALPGAFLAGGASGGYPPQGAAGAAVLGILIAGVGAGIGAISGEIEMAKHRDDFGRIVQAILAYDPPVALSRRLQERLALLDSFQMLPIGPHPPAPGAKPDTDGRLLRVSFHRLALQPCNKNLYVIEMAVRVQLWDPTADRYVYDRVLLDSHPKSLRWAPPYELRVEPPAERRKLKAWIGPEGEVLIHQDLDQAVAAVTDRILRDLNIPADD